MIFRVTCRLLMWYAQIRRRLRWGRCCDCQRPTRACLAVLAATGTGLAACPGEQEAAYQSWGGGR
ncbi:MAG: hypothetical protein ACYC7E_22725 [Armatimonadota bacterium]